jgi:sugar transferase (PEP-CTERM system associated)
MKVFSTNLTLRTAVLVASEHLLIVLSVVLALIIRWLPRLDVLPAGVLWRASLIAAVLQVCLHFCDLYNFRTLSDRRTTAIALLRALGAASLILALLYYWVPSLVIGRGVFAIASVIFVVVIAGWRITFNWLSQRLKPVERLLIVGTNVAAIELAKELFDRRQELGVELIGFVDTDRSRIGASLFNPGIIGAVSDIPLIVKERNVDRVVVSLVDARGKLSMDELLRMKLSEGVRFDHLASVYEEYTGKIAVENLRPSWLIFSEGFRRHRGVEALKRLFDMAAAVLGLALAGPIMALVALATKLTEGGPVLYSQVRVGRNEVPFTLFKFRSMRPDAETDTGPVWSSAGDPRVTRLGRLLRRTRLDELPQLWNVLRGDMSIVGPRPERPEFVIELTKQIPFYSQRHAVRPGVTGWAQVRHTYAASVADSLQKLQYDLFYIKNMSLAFDIFVVFETVKTVLVRTGS